MSDGKNILCRLNIILGASKEKFEDTKADQNPQIEGQTTQCRREKRNTTIYKTYT